MKSANCPSAAWVIITVSLGVIGRLVPHSTWGLGLWGLFFLIMQGMMVHYGLPTLWQVRHPRQAWWMAHTGKRVLAEEAAYEDELRKAIGEARQKPTGRVNTIGDYRWTSIGMLPVATVSGQATSLGEVHPDRVEQTEHPPLGAEVRIIPTRDSGRAGFPNWIDHGKLVARGEQATVCCEDRYYLTVPWEDIVWNPNPSKLFQVL